MTAHCDYWLEFCSNAAEEKPLDEERSRVVIEPSGLVKSSEKRSLVIAVDTISSFPLSNQRTFKIKISSCQLPNLFLNSLL